MDSDVLYIFSDGGYRISQNIGAWAFVMKYKNFRKESRGSIPTSTSQQCELYAAIFALEAVKDKTKKVVFTSDSQYLVSSINEWMPNWIKRNWRGSKGNTIANKELWLRIYRDLQDFKDITFVWTRGHDGNVENERCDELVNFCMDEYLEMNKLPETT